MITDRYYYNHLPAEEKQIYTLLYKGIAAHEKEIQLPGKMLTKDTVNRVFHAVTHDNPYFYYFNQTHLDYAYSPFGSVFLPQYFCSEEQVADYNKRVQECVNQLIVQLDLSICTDLEKIRRVHDYMCKHVVYDHDALKTTKVNRIVAAHSIIGVFARQRAVCEGIAKAVKLLLNAVNVGCIVVSGKASLYRQGEHAWNIVKVGDQAYHLDVTWDLANSENGHINYDYFNLPDSAILADHFEYGDVPNCSSWEANYFCKNRLVFSNIRQVEDYILAGLSHDMRSFYFRMQPDGHKMSDVATSVQNFIRIEAGNMGIMAKILTSYNEEQRTARITLERT